MIRLSVFQADGTTAVGIVTNVLTASYGADVNSIGSWSATIPADSVQAGYFSDRYRVKIDVGDEGYVFQGIVTKRVTKVQGEDKVLEVSGWSTARELVDRDTGQGFELESETLEDAFDAVLAIEGTWTTGTIGSPALAVWSRRFDGVKLWQGLIKLADMFGVLFREDSRTRSIDAGAFGDDSGLTFRNWEGPVPQDAIDGVVLLSAIESAVESQDIVTRVEPRGQRQGITGDDFTLAAATDTTLYTTQSGTRNSLTYYYLVDTTAETAYGQIEATIRVSDVLPLGLDPSTDLVRAANALHGVAATWLSRRKDPLRSYTFRAEGLKHVVSATDTFKVGQKARVKWSGATADGVWIDIDEDLWIMGYRRTITSDGRSAWSFKTSNVPREVPDSTLKLQEMYEQFDASLTAPWPILSWGGTPPIGRLTPAGVQIKTAISGADTTVRALQHTSADFSSVYAERYGDLDSNEFTLHERIYQQSADTIYRWDIWSSSPSLITSMRLFDTDGDDFASNAQLFKLYGESQQVAGLQKVDDRWVWMLYDDAANEFYQVGGGMYPPQNFYELLANEDGAFCRFGLSGDGGVPAFMYATLTGDASGLDATEGLYAQFVNTDVGSGGSSFIHYHGPGGKSPSTRVPQPEWENVTTVSIKWRGSFPDNADYEMSGVGFGADFATTNNHKAFFSRNSGNWQLGSSDGSTHSESAAGTADGNWHDFELQWDSSALRGYVDGSLVITKTSNMPTGHQALRIQGNGGAGENINISTQTVTWS